MGYKVTVNIRDRKTNEFICCILCEYDNKNNIEFLYRKALNEISNYLKRYLQYWEIHQGKYSTADKKYWSVQPSKCKEKATIISEKY